MISLARALSKMMDEIPPCSQNTTKQKEDKIKPALKAFEHMMGECVTSSCVIFGWVPACFILANPYGQGMIKLSVFKSQFQCC